MFSTWQQEQQALTDMARYPHLPQLSYVSSLPTEARNTAAVRLFHGSSQYAKLVYVCYFCNQFIVGGCCFAHHSVTCARNHSHQWYVPVSITACSYRWVNCARCIKQALFASSHTLLPQVKLTLHWARIVAKLFEKQQQLAAWKCTTKQPCFYVPLSATILNFL